MKKNEEKPQPLIEGTTVPMWMVNHLTKFGNVVIGRKLLQKYDNAVLIGIFESQDCKVKIEMVDNLNDTTYIMQLID
ncbi:MAG: hypothetical protein RR623_04745 [Bacilli bacterium]